MLILLLQLSVGLGYDMEDDYSFETKDWKGIIQIEQPGDSITYGFWHSSQINNGFHGDPEDQNIFYIKRDFKL